MLRQPRLTCCRQPISVNFIPRLVSRSKCLARKSITEMAASKFLSNQVAIIEKRILYAYITSSSSDWVGVWSTMRLGLDLSDRNVSALRKSMTRQYRGYMKVWPSDQSLKKSVRNVGEVRLASTSDQLIIRRCPRCARPSQTQGTFGWDDQVQIE